MKINYSGLSEKCKRIMVWACHKVIRTCQNNPARNSARKENERKTEEEMRGQYHQIDGVGVEIQPEASRRQREVTGAGCRHCDDRTFA